MATCKGRKKDGTPCRSPIVLDNGYCRQTNTRRQAQW
jgi:hypothetical protein